MGSNRVVQKVEFQICLYLRIAIFKQKRTNRAFKKRERGATKVEVWGLEYA